MRSSSRIALERWWWIAAVLIVTYAVPAIGAGSPTTKIIITLDDDCSDQIQGDAQVILTVGGYTASFSARQEAKNRWVYTLPDGTIPSDGAWAILMLKSRHTSPTQSIEGTGGEALFQFHCSMQTAWTVYVSTEGDMAVDYRRRIGADFKATLRFDAGDDATPIKNVHASSEGIQLWIGADSRNLLDEQSLPVLRCDNPCHSLFGPDPKNRRLPMFNSNQFQSMKSDKQSAEFNLEQVADAIYQQRVARVGEDPNARVATITALERVRLTKLTLKVK
jgi:hypothetical protein